MACFSPIASVSSAVIIWCITTSPVAEAKASSPSLIAPATSASATVASSGRSANRAASSTSATLTTATFFFIGGPLSGWFLDWSPEHLPHGRAQEGDHHLTSTNLGTSSIATCLAERHVDDAIIAKKCTRGSAGGTKNQPMGLRWPVERTNSWLSNFGQLRRNTDRFSVHRLAQFALAVALIITVKLVKWAQRWGSLAVA